jgi:hypothetical protein
MLPERTLAEMGIGRTVPLLYNCCYLKYKSRTSLVNASSEMTALLVGVVGRSLV